MKQLKNHSQIQNLQNQINCFKQFKKSKEEKLFAESNYNGPKVNKPYQQDYSIVSKNDQDELFVRHKKTAKQYLLRKVIVKSEHQMQERVKLLNHRKKIKSEHLLNIVNFTPINNDQICGNTNYVSLLIQYPFESLLYETIHRQSQPNLSAKSLNPRPSSIYFQEHQLWSILYSCVLGLETLYMNDMPHEGITKSLIFVDKDGVVKIGDPILLGARTNYDRVIEQLEHQKNKKNNTQRSNNFGQSSSKPSSIKINQTVDKSFIVSPELISLCKDHQYYFFDKEKSDVFVLGATMIELGLLEDVASVNTKEKIFKTNFSDYFKENGKLYQMYSTALLSIIESMVQLDPKKRPSLSQIVQRIEQFSMQESTISQQSNLVGNRNELPPRPENYTFMNPSSNSKYQAERFGLSDSGFQSKSYQTNNFQYASALPPVNWQLGYATNSNLPSANQGLSYNHFPSFSMPQTNKLTQSIPNDYPQNFANSGLSKKLPVQIKYVQSPLIVPVSNVRFNEKNMNYSTPFNDLNLTESNQKGAVERTIDKESVVQNKFTLFGANNIDAQHLFQKPNFKEQKLTNNVTQRFSFHNFGKIQIPNTSNQTSLNTSTFPTPRFQNQPANIQPNLYTNDMTRPLSTPTFNSINSPNYGIRSSFNPPTFANLAYNNLNAYAQSNNSYSQGRYQSQISLQRKVHVASYDPKKQGFSIGDGLMLAETYSFDNQLEPYFHNSSVGYTLPKYRPESAFSEIVEVTSQQKAKGSQRKLSVNSAKNIHNISPNQQIPETESIIHQKPPIEIAQVQTNFNSQSAINSVTNLDNQKIQTNSNTSTVKKQPHGPKKDLGKKYNFYKKELDEKLQKIQQPSPMVSVEIQKPSHKDQQKAQSPLLGRQLKVSNTVIKIDFQPQSHTIYVQEMEQSGCMYRGQKLNNQKHGNGILVFADSGFYDGQFSHDQMEGYGKLYYNECDLAYQGQFKINCFDGWGVLYNNKPQGLQGRFDFANLTNIHNFWLKYEGFFKEDQKSGKCHIFFTNGEQFEGYCQNNTFQGKGKFKTIDSSCVEGIWKNNVLVEIQADTEFQIQNQ